MRPLPIVAFALATVWLAGLWFAMADPEKAPAGGRIAITFDDVPRSPGVFLGEDERAAKLIAGLERAGVTQAAFFLNPGRIPERTGAEARIAAYVGAGHVIANHTNTHPHLSQVSAREFLADLDAASAWLEGRDGARPWFRYPFLDEGRADKTKRDAVRAGLAERGLKNAYVTVDASDWFYAGQVSDAVREGQQVDRDALRDLFVESHVEAAAFYADLARRSTGRAPAHTLLMHETDLAALYIEDLIAALRNEGWEIITADEAYGDPIAIEAARYDTPSAGGTLIEMVAWERGLPPPRWYARNDTRRAGAEFRKRVLIDKDKSED